MNREFSKSEFLPLTKIAYGDITDYSVGFLKVNSQMEWELAGSGTLIQVNGIKAILTAHHVLKNLPKEGPVGLLTPTRAGSTIHKFSVEAQSLRNYEVARGTDDSKGPDLGLVILARSDWTRLPSGKIFVNLNKHGDYLKALPPTPTSGAWVICGNIHEFTGGLSPEDQARFGKGKSFFGGIINGRISNQRQDGDFDYVSVQFEYNTTYEGPQGFGGCSGGGLWYLPAVEEADGKIQFPQAIFAGVVFYQSGLIGIQRSVVCHGPVSVYGKLIEYVKTIAVET